MCYFTCFMRGILDKIFVYFYVLHYSQRNVFLPVSCVLWCGTFKMFNLHFTFINCILFKAKGRRWTHEMKREVCVCCVMTDMPCNMT